MFGNFQDLDQNGSGWRYTTSLNDYGVYIYIHIKSSGRVRYEHFTEKERYTPSMTCIHLNTFDRQSLNTRNEILEI